MTTVTKVAISIPVETLRSLERARARLRKTRSAVVTEAVERWLSSEAMGNDDARYVQGYLRTPEQPGGGAEVALAAVASWEPWE